MSEEYILEQLRDFGVLSIGILVWVGTGDMGEWVMEILGRREFWV